MTRWTTLFVCSVVALAVPTAMAQESQAAREAERERIAAEREAALEAREHAREQQEIERERVRDLRDAGRDVKRRMIDVEIEMREAETRMAEAARRIAELSTRNLPSVSGNVWATEVSGSPVLGITIGAPDGQGPVEGVDVLGVSPGGAAAEAGLRAGDVITAVNEEALSADDSSGANQKLLDFMSALEEGDVIDVEYLRAGQSGSVEVSPRPMSPQVFSFAGPGGRLHIPSPPSAPAAQFNRFVFVSDGQGWGDMEMVKLTEGLGRYFGTDEGLLVVRAPKDESFKLQDGDVILNIDGRTPNSVSHAIRILGSYQDGESLEISIMRDKRKQTLDIEMPQANLVRPSQGTVMPSVVPRVTSRVRVVPGVSPTIAIRSSDERDDQQD